MVKIRLARLGDKKSPFYRIVVADERASRDGRFVEVLGTFDPLKETAVIDLDVEKAKTWIKNGAQPTDTVKAILVAQGVIPQGKPAPAKTGHKKKTEE